MPALGLEEEKAATAAEVNLSLQTLTDWDGEDDPENPRNWSFGKKLYATSIPALYAFVVYVVLHYGSIPG